MTSVNTDEPCVVDVCIALTVNRVIAMEYFVDPSIEYCNLAGYNNYLLSCVKYLLLY